MTVTGRARDGYDGPTPLIIVVSAPAPGALTETQSMLYSPWGTIAGTVSDDLGAAVAGATVALSSGVGAATTDLSGHYVLASPRGTWTLTVSAPAHVTSVGTATVTTNAATTGVDVTLTRQGAAEGDALDSHGNALVSIEIDLVQGTTRVSAFTNAQGHFVLFGTPGAAQVVGGSATGLDAPAAVPVTLTTGGDVTGVALVYHFWGHVTGYILDPSGNGLAGLTVRTDTGQSGTTDSTGHYSIAAPAGVHTLTVDRTANVVTPTTPQSATVASETDTTAVNWTASPYRTITVTVETQSHGAVVSDDGTNAHAVVTAADSFTGGTDTATRPTAARTAFSCRPARRRSTARLSPGS